MTGEFVGAARTPGPRPIPGEAALRLPPEGGRPAELVLADLHLGLGEFGAGGTGLAADEARSMARRLIRAARGARAEGLLVVGDFKHPIVGVPRPVRPMIEEFCAALRAADLRLAIIPGNHDGDLGRHLPPEVERLPAGGLRRGSVALFHGHARPDPGVLDGARTLIVGHLHPGYRLAGGEMPDTGKRRCWLRTEMPGPIPGTAAPAPAPAPWSVIVLPAYNPLCGIEALNQGSPRRSRSFLWRRFLLGGRSRAYLLDGTDLGPVVTPPGRATEVPRRARPDRSPGAGRRSPRIRGPGAPRRTAAPPAVRTAGAVGRGRRTVEGRRTGPPGP